MSHLYFVMVFEIHEKPQFFQDKQLHFIFSKKLLVPKLLSREWQYPILLVSYIAAPVDVSWNGIFWDRSQYIIKQLVVIQSHLSGYFGIFVLNFWTVGGDLW